MADELVWCSAASGHTDPANRAAYSPRFALAVLVAHLVLPAYLFSHMPSFSLCSSSATSQHIDTPDNTVETKFDFNEENYKRVEMVCFFICSCL